MIISTFKRVWKILPSHYKVSSVFLLIGVFVSSVTEIIGIASILPLLATVLKSELIEQNEILNSLFAFFSFETKNQFIVWMSIAILTFIVAKNIFGLWVQRKLVWFTWNLHETLALKILSIAYQRGFLYFSGNNSNTILNHVQTVPIQFSGQLIRYVFQFISECFILLLVVLSLLFYDPYILLLLAGIVLPLNVIFYRLVKHRIGYYGTRLNELQPLISRPVFEVIFGYVDVVINHIFGAFQDKFRDRLREAKHIRVNMLTLQNIPQRIIETSVIISVLIMILYGIFQLKEVEKIVAMMSVLGLAAYRCIPSVNRILLAMVEIRNQQFSIDIIEEFLEDKEVKSQNELLPFTKKFHIQDITFSYPDAPRPIIKQFSLEIRKGESVGIMGKSGSGKTTLMNIMLGFITPASGSIIIDGKPLNSNTKAEWQKKCGYVRQDVFLADGSVKDNVAFGVHPDDIDEEKLKEVIEKAQLTELASSLPDGIETNIGERGAKISGGQRQRVGIARALYHGAEILFFDEATSALDYQTEKEITEAIRELHLQKLTMVIIAHRESTLKYCDKIISL